jgi:hypothetical protein
MAIAQFGAEVGNSPRARYNRKQASHSPAKALHIYGYFPKGRSGQNTQNASQDGSSAEA